MDARRLELYELLKPKLDEEAASKLVLALPPDPETIATKDDMRMEFERFAERVDARFAAYEARVDARFARMEATLTRRMVTIMGAWTILVGPAFGWAALLLR